MHIYLYPDKFGIHRNLRDTMKHSLHRFKLKVPILIKRSGKVIFINNNKGYAVSSSREVVTFIKQLSVGMKSDLITNWLKKNSSINALYAWLKNKNWIVDDLSHPIENTPNEKNHDYICSINKDPISVLNKFKVSHISIVGCGGTGSVVAQNLVAMGFRMLSVVDYDKIESSNLNRQTIYSHADVGKNKAEILAEKLKLLNNEVHITSHIQKVTCKEDLVKIYKNNRPAFVVCGIDTPPVIARDIVLRFCELSNIPCIFGGVGVDSGSYGPLIDTLQGMKLFRNFLSKIKDEYYVGEISIVKGSLCPTNSIISSFIALDIFKWFSNTNPLSHNKILKVDFNVGQIEQSTAFDCYEEIEDEQL